MRCLYSFSDFWWDSLFPCFRDDYRTLVAWHDPDGRTGTGQSSQLPAFPLLRDHLADTAAILCDDTGREPECGMVADWMQMEPALLRTDYALEKGAVVLEYRRRVQGG